MPNVLVRDVPPDDLDVIRVAAREQGSSLQGYLLATVHGQAAYLRRQAALRRAAQRLTGRPAVPEPARQAVFDAVDTATDGADSDPGSGEPTRL